MIYKGIGLLYFTSLATMGILFLIGSSSASSIPMSYPAEDINSDDIAESSSIEIQTPNDTCVEEGIFGIRENKTAFFKCVVDNEASTTIFRKYNMECPINTFFDAVSKNCEAENRTPKPPLVVGSVFGVIKHSETGNCLRTTSKDHVLARECNGDNLEGWDSFSDGRIKNFETRKCLEGDEDGHVFTASCNGKANQRWTQDGANRYVNLGSNRCLSSNVVGYVHTGLCNDGIYKRWD